MYRRTLAMGGGTPVVHAGDDHSAESKRRMVRMLGRLEAAVRSCEECGNGRQRPVLRARVAEGESRTALVLGVPVEVCDSCGRVSMTMDVAKRLDELFTTMLASDVEVAVRHFGPSQSICPRR
jgi:hypothetical protein